MLNRRLKNFFMVLAFTAVINLNTAVFAQPISRRNNPFSKSQELEKNIENLDNQIEDVMGKISDNKKQILKKEEDIRNSQTELKKAQSELDKEKELFNSRIKVLYVNGTYDYLSMLLESKGIGDFITRVEAIKNIINFDSKLISDYNAKQKDIAGRIDRLNTENKKLLVLKEENENKLKELNKNKSDQKKLIAQAKEQEKQYEAAQRAAVSAAVKQVYIIRTAAPKISSSGKSSPITDDNVVAYATNFLGTPYLWGGTSPSTGFDCSGFTQYVYRHFGIYLGRTTYDQIQDGVGVSRDELQPGDLVFFGEGGNPTHMGMYVGNGAFIHAPHTGDVVKISPLIRSDYITARRVK